MNPYETGPLRLMTYLTRRQAWLSAPEVASRFHVGSRRLSERTIHRWFALLRRQAGFAYYPSPRSSLMGLQDVSVRIHGLRSVDLLNVVPFGAEFAAELDLADGHPVLTVDFRIPPSALKPFRAFWSRAEDLGLLEAAQVFPWRTVHEFYSPFQEVVRENGSLAASGTPDNRYFAALAHRDILNAKAPEVGGPFARFPLVIPNVVEHLFGCFSSHQVWAALEAKEGGPILRRRRARALSSRKMRRNALREIQEQWKELTSAFDECFSQPILRINTHANAAIHSFELTPRDPVQAALGASQWSLRATLRTDWGDTGRARIRCLHPGDRFTQILHTMREQSVPGEPVRVFSDDPTAAEKVGALFRCTTDWSLFDPESLAWDFEADRYEKQAGALVVPDTSWIGEYFRVPRGSLSPAQAERRTPHQG